MTINFIGNFQNGYSGEIADEVHIARSMEEQGHEVRCIPRDEWREYVLEGFPEGKYPNIPKKLKADINIIAKWHHFGDPIYISMLRMKSNAPVFYWVWDSVDLNIDWHRKMAQASDLYLSGELGRVQEFHKHNIRFYYFQFDCVDGDIGVWQRMEKKYDVTYLGSCDNQNGRVDLLKAINKEIPIQIFGNSPHLWAEQGFDKPLPAVYGMNANQIISESKVVLGTSCDPHLYGYWSNRVGRVLQAKGLLLQQYAPGMENFLHDWVEYYSSPEEAVEKIRGALQDYDLRKKEGVPRYLFTSEQKVKDLLILAERFLKEKNGKYWQLP